MTIAGSGKGFGYLFEMGCGKTLTAIATMGAMYKMGVIEKVLIVAPSSVCNVWTKDIPEGADYTTDIALLLGDTKQRKKALDSLKSSRVNGLKVAVINYEGLRTTIYEDILSWCPDMVIADESQRIKTHDAQQSKAMHQLGDATKFKLILSGTPVQNNALDIYSQYRFLDPSVFGTNYYAFRNKYAIMGGFQKHQVIGYRDMDGLIKKEHSIAYRVTKDECLDLPEQVFTDRTIPLEGKAKQLYMQLKRSGFAELSNGDTITAPQVITKYLRLQQFTGGFLQADEAAVPEFVFNGKINALDDILEDYVIDSNKKLVIFCRFRPEIDLIQRLIDAKKLKSICICGDVKLEDRGALIDDFQNNPETKVALLQIDTAGLGITLTAADTCVYYSVNWNYAAYSQSLARIHRIGQKNRCTYIRLIVEGSIDKLVYEALESKEDIAKLVVDHWRDYLGG